MEYRLSDLTACFEGVIPSIIATAAADGTPNISYLSHVVAVDDGHIALSNQFFAKTAANIRANPDVTLIIVDCVTGDQYLLQASFVRSIDAGPLFEKIALQLKASSDQIGMGDVMRLRSADVFRVNRIEKVPSPVETPTVLIPRAPVSLPLLADAAKSLEREVEAERIIDLLLHSVRDVLRYGNAVVLIRDKHRTCFVTTGSMGYERSGVGSEVAGDSGLVGAAATNGQTVRVNDISRVRRLGDAIAADVDLAENDTRTVAFPALPHAMSQIAVPMTARDQLQGVLLVESAERMAFRDEDAAALEILATHAAHALGASEAYPLGDEAEPASSRQVLVKSGRELRIVHHRYDDSIFVDEVYIVKGIAGALLRQMVEWYLSTGRSEFSNRELRLTLAARMPDIKDNLETRLLLLRRRLEKKGAELLIVRNGRGRLQLACQRPISLISS